MRLLVRLSDGGSNGKAARIVVLDHGNRNLRSEIPHGTPGCISIDIVVVAHRLATELFSMCEAVLVQRIEIQRGLLVRILAITQNMGTIPSTGECGRELGLIHFRLVFGSRMVNSSRLRPMLRGPLVDGGIIRCRMRECFAGQPATFLKGETFTVLDTGRNQRIIVRIRDDGHGGVVLRRSANHGRASDIDLFNSGGFVRTGTNRISERVQVDDHQIERLDAKLFQLSRVVLIGHISEDTCVDMWIEGFDTAIETLGKTSDFRDFRHLDAEFRKTLCSGTSGNHFSAGLDERLGKNFYAFLMEDRYQSSTYRSIRCCHPAPPYC